MPYTTPDFANPIVKFLFRVTGGRMKNPDKLPVVLLTYTGKRSGKHYTVPLVGMEHEGRFLITASNAGKPHHPTWYSSILANPTVEVAIGSRRQRAVAAVIPPDERPKLWLETFGRFKRFTEYQSMAGEREIPVIALRPLN